MRCLVRQTEAPFNGSKLTPVYVRHTSSLLASVVYGPISWQDIILGTLALKMELRIAACLLAALVVTQW